MILTIDGTPVRSGNHKRHTVFVNQDARYLMHRPFGALALLALTSAFGDSPLVPSSDISASDSARWKTIHRIRVLIPELNIQCGGYFCELILGEGDELTFNRENLMLYENEQIRERVRRWLI